MYSLIPYFVIMNWEGTNFSFTLNKKFPEAHMVERTQTHAQLSTLCKKSQNYNYNLKDWLSKAGEEEKDMENCS